MELKIKNISYLRLAAQISAQSFFEKVKSKISAAAAVFLN
jgi:hypothetical protein